jgi:hypothetical protein
MNDPGIDENIDQLKGSLGNVVIEGCGKNKDRIRYVVKTGKEEGEYPNTTTLKPSTLIRQLVLYLVCQYILETKEEVALVLLSVPGMFYSAHVNGF